MDLYDKVTVGETNGEFQLLAIKVASDTPNTIVDQIELTPLSAERTFNRYENAYIVSILADLRFLNFFEDE